MIISRPVLVAWPPFATAEGPDKKAGRFFIWKSEGHVAACRPLSRDDLDLIAPKRLSQNRLGFAVRLCLIRHPGRTPDPDDGAMLSTPSGGKSDPKKSPQDTRITVGHLTVP